MPPKKKSVESTEEIAKPKVKRASAKHKIVAVVTNEGIQGSFQQTENRKPLIVHLPIQSNTVKFYDHPLMYDPLPPKETSGFDINEINPFEEQGDIFDNNELVQQIKKSYSEEKPVESTAIVPVVKETVVPIVPVSRVSKEYGPTKLLIEYANTKYTHELPSCTTTACFWCCEQFGSRPCVIPISIISNIWHVYGNFCNPHCALASLLNEPMDTHIRWERIALMNMLYSSGSTRIYPAPDRSVLQRFGGPMPPEEYRDLCERGRLRLDIHMPPLVSILASMDTKPVDFYESTLMNNVPHSQNQTVDNGLKLKRNKPLKEREHTLDKIFNLQPVKN